MKAQRLGNMHWGPNPSQSAFLAVRHSVVIASQIANAIGLTGRQRNCRVIRHRTYYLRFPARILLGRGVIVRYSLLLTYSAMHAMHCTARR